MIYVTTWMIQFQIRKLNFKNDTITTQLNTVRSINYLQEPMTNWRCLVDPRYLYIYTVQFLSTCFVSKSTIKMNRHAQFANSVKLHTAIN